MKVSLPGSRRPGNDVDRTKGTRVNETVTVRKDRYLEPPPQPEYPSQWDVAERDAFLKTIAPIGVTLTCTLTLTLIKTSPTR